eukprot:4702820-Pyramimonas_sp.AAC.1
MQSHRLFTENYPGLWPKAYGRAELAKKHHDEHVFRHRLGRSIQSLRIPSPPLPPRLVSHPRLCHAFC